MVLSQTPYGVKQACLQVLDETLNDGLMADNPEYVNIFYGWKEADAVGRFVVVGDASTLYETEEVRLDARSTLRRYDLTYNINIDIASGLANRTQMTAERQCYDLFDRVLTPLVRGDRLGGSAILPLVDGISQVAPISDEFLVKPDDAGQPAYAVLRLILGVELIRD